MTTKTISAHWTGEELNFIGADTKGRHIPMGGKDVSPSQLVLIGLAGCTGMDVVSILQKKRLNITSVEVQVTGHQPDEYPKLYTLVEIKYLVKGDKLDPKAVQRAIELSSTKYCVVSQTLQHPVEIKTSFELV
jgi:putative redox protein